MRPMSDATNGNAFYLSLGAAAQQAGVAKSTLSRAIRNGKLSAQRCPETNALKVDPAELARFLDATRIVRLEHSAPAVPAADPALATQVQVLESKLALTERHLEEVRADRDEWRQQAQRLALPGPERRRWRWWRRA